MANPMIQRELGPVLGDFYGGRQPLLLAGTTDTEPDEGER